MATRNNLIEQVKAKVRAASTAFGFGKFVKETSATAGTVSPLTPVANVVGLGLEEITSQDPYYATAMDMYVDGINKTIDRFLCACSGTATKAMEGKTFNISASDAGTVDVRTYLTVKYDTLAVGTYAVGETVTGGTSGATGVVDQVIGSDVLVLITLSGTFVLGETLTGGTSSSTSKLRTLIVGGVQFTMERFISATLAEFSVALAENDQPFI